MLKVLFLLVVLGIAQAALLPLLDHRVHIFFCDVGQGDATLIQYKTQQFLIDVGPDSRKIVECLQESMPRWDRTVEIVLLTHPDSDHIGGFTELNKQYQVSTLITSPIHKKTGDFDALKRLVLTEQSTVQSVLMPLHKQVISFCPYCQFEILITRGEQETFFDQKSYFSETILQDSDTKNEHILSNSNDLSIGTFLHIQDIKLLFLDDREVAAIQALIDDGLIDTVNVLKVPHHGAKNGLNSEIISVFRPETFVISSGKNNSYGHPHTDILDQISSNNGTILRTDTQGTIHFISNGIKYYIGPKKDQK